MTRSGLSMSALTIFLGKLLGVYCLIVALTMMANRQTMVDAVHTLIVGWVSLIKGVVLLALPAGQMAKLYKAMRYERFYLAYVGVTLALGLYLTIAAFSA